MRVVLGANGLAIAELTGHHAKRHPRHREAGGVSVAENVKADGRGDAGGFAGRAHGADLFALGPAFSIGAGEDQGLACFAGAMGGEKFPAFIGENDETGLAGFAHPDMKRCGIRVKV